MASRVAPDDPFFLGEFYKKRLFTKKSIFDDKERYYDETNNY